MMENIMVNGEYFYTVITEQSAPHTWEMVVSRCHAAGWRDEPVDRAVTHCAALVEENHENMVARYTGLKGREVESPWTDPMDW